MVCKNCGADLKPGSKYCLECGNYIEDNDFLDEEDSSYDYPSAPVASTSIKRKRKKLNLTTTDYLIYGGLFLVMIICIIVIIVTLIKDSSEPVVTPTPTVSAPVERADKKLNIDDYSVVVPGELDSTVQGSFLYATDNENYKFSFQIKEEEFDAYYDNQATLKEQLIKNKYDVLSVFEKKANGRLFLLYELQADGAKKVLYLTKINSKYTTFGTIELFESGDWQQALPMIDTICNTVSFQFE